MKSRWSVVATSVLLLLVAVFGAYGSVAQEATPITVATPVEEVVCYFSPENPISVQLEAGQEALITLTPDCEPIIEIMALGESGENWGSDDESAGVNPHRNSLASLPGSTSIDPESLQQTSAEEAEAAATSLNNTCRGTTRVHDVVHWNLSRQHVIAKWYYNGSIVKGRSSSSHTDTSESATTGWQRVSAENFFWYYPSSPPQTPAGAEGWTEFTWINGQYRHTHQTILWMHGNGTCYGNLNIWGTLSDAFHVHEVIEY